MNTKVLVIGCSVLSAAAGAVAGYFVSRKQIIENLEDEYTRMLDAEKEALKNHYAALYKADEFSDPVKVLARRTPKKPEGLEDETEEQIEANANVGAEAFRESLKEHRANKEIIASNRYGPPNIPVNPAKPALKKPETNNVFENIPPDEPGSDAPYCITIEEFHEGLKGYETVTLKLYSDGQLVDERDEPVDDVNATVGLENVRRMGQPNNGSNSEDALYIRNDRIEMDFEIIALELTYAEFLGLNPGPNSTKRAKSRR